MQVSEHLEAERRTVKALRAELQSLSTSTESHVTRLATELEAKQGLLRGLQTTVQSAKADAESSRSQAEAASSALASLRDAGSDLDKVSAQLNRERQVRMVHCEWAFHEHSSSCRLLWVRKCACLLVAVRSTAGRLVQAGEGLKCWGAER